MTSPKSWAPESPNQASLEALEKILSVAIEAKLINRAEAEKMWKILLVNPHHRLAALGTRIARLQETLEEIKGSETSLESLVATAKTEYHYLHKLLATHPLWEEEE
jgi:hypothetical protein